jgi:hypothetical protein
MPTDQDRRTEMGLIRKAASMSTLGGVKYTSRREAETKERLANAKLMRAQLKQQEPSSQWDEILAAFEAGEATWDDLGRMQKLQMPITYQMKCKAAQRRQTGQQTEQEPVQSWDEILAAFEAGEMTPDNLTRAQWAKMPFGYQVKCRRLLLSGGKRLAEKPGQTQTSRDHWLG